MTGSPWSSQDTQHCLFIITLNLRILWVELFQIFCPSNFLVNATLPCTKIQRLTQRCSFTEVVQRQIVIGVWTMAVAQWQQLAQIARWSMEQRSASLEAWHMESQRSLLCVWHCLTCLLWLFRTQSTSVYWRSAASFLHLWFEMSKNGLLSKVFFRSLGI